MGFRYLTHGADCGQQQAVGVACSAQVELGGKMWKEKRRKKGTRSYIHGKGANLVGALIWWGGYARGAFCLTRALIAMTP
jgi:hypothetical protein